MRGFTIPIFPHASAAGFDSTAVKPRHREIQIMAINVRPLGDRVLVEAAEEKEAKNVIPR